jgi:hypothetical protein
MVKGYRWATFVPHVCQLCLSIDIRIRNRMEGVVGHKNGAPENDDRLIHPCHEW